jgi:hypothetical protein
MGPGGGYPPQSMYNGPSSGSMGQMSQGGPGMYGNMMNRGMPGYSAPYGNMPPMSSQYGGFNSHMGPGQGPGPGPGPGSGPPPPQSSSGPMPMAGSQMMGGQAMGAGMGQQGMAPMQPGGPMMPGGKGAQAAAQAALMAAASSAGTRGMNRGMAGSPRMMGPGAQGSGGGGSPSPGMMMNHMGNLGNPSLNSMSNQIQQITPSNITAMGKPASPAHADSQLTPSMSGDGMPSAGGMTSPMSGSDTQDYSRPSSTTNMAAPGPAGDGSGTNATTDNADGSGSMPSSDSTSVDSGFHSAADHNEKPLSSPHSNSNPPLPPSSSASNGPVEGASHDQSADGKGGPSNNVPSAAVSSGRISFELLYYSS